MKRDKRSHRIGLSMRVVSATTYPEARDALSQEWGPFMNYALPKTSWIPVPNLGADVVEFVDRWNLDGLILTGGDDIGATPVRDETETVLLNRFLEKEFPVFGVCRGLQFLVKHFKGTMAADTLKNHVDRRHAVRFVDDAGTAIKSGVEFVTNSYHENIVNPSNVLNPLIPFALAMDQTVEGVLCKTFPLMAIMWHPERERPFKTIDRRMIRWFFGVDR